MQVIKPLTLTMLPTRTGFATDSTPTWIPTSAYTIGDIVQGIGITGNKYQAIQTVPALSGIQLTDTAYWKWIGYINELAYLDSQSSTTAVGSSNTQVCDISGVINTPFDSIAALNVTAEELRLTVTMIGASYDSGWVQSETTTISSWYDYFFADKTFKKDFVFQNIPVSIIGTSAAYILTIKPRVDTPVPVQIGSLIAGQMKDIGGTQYGAKLGIIDYSRKTTDDFGVTTFVKRAFSKRMSASTFVQNTQLTSVFNTLSEIRATPTVWIASSASDLEEPTTVFGYYKDFSIDIQYPAHSLCSLEIEGLT